MRAALALAVVFALGGCVGSAIPPLTYDAGIVDDAAWTDDILGPRYHPLNYGAGDVHGSEFNLQKQDCRACHGATLLGGTGPSCDTCHTPNDPPAWRSNCLYCHGGVENATGAPPRNLDYTMDAPSGPFPVHNVHVSSTLTSTLDCTQCHVKATDVMSPNHVFDSTPGRAETDFGAGKSKMAAWDGKSTCTNVYCHGNGQGDNGTIHISDGKRDCGSCHAGPASGAAAWDKMSGAHSLHLAQMGITCADCHNAVTKDSATIADRGKHIDRLAEVDFSTAVFTFDAAARTCTGSCHNFAHSGSGWTGTVGGRFHPVGYAAASMHGPDMELQRLDCRGCHGTTLTGSGSAPSCDGCHKAGWRTNCTYCHGGSVNQTGAPPRDLASAPAAVSQSFRAHTAHLTQTIAPAVDCTTCHIKPTDVLSTNHAFDSTPARAEITFAGGLGNGGSYDGAGSCTVYCHGNGRTNGTYKDGAATPGCGTCHAGMASGQTAWGTMSGEHRKHLQMSGVNCATCHASVTTDGTQVIAPLLHVNGMKEVVLNVSGIGPYNPSTRICAGSCHGEDHGDKRW